MKLEAKTRLQAATKVCGCVTAACEHDVEAELTEKQKQLDINGDGEIDSEDLRRLRKGEKPEQLEAAPISNEVESRFMAALFKHANLKSLGFYLKAGEIRSKDLLTQDEMDQLLTKLKGVGFSKKWAPKRAAAKGTIGLATKDGKWPLVITPFKAGNLNDVSIELTTHDTLDTSEKKLDIAGFKSVVHDVVSTLGVKTESKGAAVGSIGYDVEVKDNTITVDTAKKLLRKKYGTPKVYPAQGSPNRGMVLVFKVDYAKLRLVFTKELRTIECVAI